MALALLTASALTNDVAARDVAHQAIQYERSVFVPSAKNWHGKDDVVSWGAGDWVGASRGVAVCGFLACAVGDSGCGEGDGEEWLWRELLFVSRRSGERGVSGGGGGSIRGRAVARDVAQIAAGVMQGIDERGWRCGTWRGGGDAWLSDGAGGYWRWVVAGCGDAAAQRVDAGAAVVSGVRVPRGRRQAEKLVGDGVRAAVAVLEEHANRTRTAAAPAAGTSQILNQSCGIALRREVGLDHEA